MQEKASVSTLLVLYGAALWWFVRQDVADYAAFKALRETSHRQQRFRIWILKSFVLFSGGSVAGLAIRGRLRSVLALPTEFAPLSLALRSAIPAQRIAASGFLLGLIGGAALTGVGLGFWLRKRVATSPGVDVLPDVSAMMPRNRTETGYAALLSLNAGLGEELFFRLLLPLLLTELLGNVVVAVVVAVVIFGAVHLYQGLGGVVATMLIGLALSVLYLWTESLWIAIAAHALLDLIGLVVRPTFARRRAAG